jgi:hypothetical protein
MSDNPETQEMPETPESEEQATEQTGLKVGMAFHPITGEPSVVLQVTRFGETQNILMPADEAHQVGSLLTLNATLVLTMRNVAGMIQQSAAAANAPKIHLPR